MVFGLVGDSGAGVWDDKGNLKSMLWGMNHKTGYDGYITPIQEILSRIHSHLGLRLFVKRSDEDEIWRADEEELKFKQR